MDYLILTGSLLNFFLNTGYDKLKPFGFPIHGAIDGYSRKILWLEVSRSNNNPKVIAQFYLDCVKTHSGCPILLRTDCGTENGIMAAMQCYLRQDGNDEFSGEKAHRYGTSPSNQRIECWWSFLRRSRSSWWINHFKEMSANGLLDVGNPLHTECLWFCYESVLQEDLDKVKHHWNSHRIRPSRNGTVPGIPDVLYFLPENFGCCDCKVMISGEKLDELNINVQSDDVNEIEDECHLYQEYFHYVMENENLQFPTSAVEAHNLFVQLITIATN